MKIIGISVFRNEADIIETFLRYHLQIVDLMLVINHRSVDSSALIIRSLQREGLPIEYFEEKRDDFQQSTFMTHLMKKAAMDYNADWVVPLDVDEFLTVSGRGTVRSIFESLPQDKTIKISYKSYVPLSSDNQQEPNILKRVQNRRTSEDTRLKKILVPRYMAMKKRGIIAVGNHGYVKVKLNSKQKEYPYIHTDRLFLAHFPVRSSQQILMKAFVGWLAILAKPNKEPTEGCHIKLLFDRFINNDQILTEELSIMALNYIVGNQPLTLSPDNIILDPVCSKEEDFELRFHALSSANCLAVVAKIAEEYAGALAAERRKKFDWSAAGRNPLASMIRLWKSK